MRVLLSALLLLPCLAFGQFFFWDATKPLVPTWNPTAGSFYGACSDTSFSVTGAGNDTSCAFMVTPGLTLQLNLVTADADSLAKIVVKVIWSTESSLYQGSVVPVYSAFTDSVCGNKATIAQSLIPYDSGYITATGWQVPRNISTDCPAVWAAIVVDGQSTNGNTTATTGSFRVTRYKNP